MYKIIFLLLTVIFSLPTLARSPAPENVEIYFISPQDGEKTSNPVVIRFGLKNMGIAPAGIDSPNTGHHHLLIDTELPNLDFPIISDEKHRHFGKGQTETTLDLPPGQHTLQLLLGDHTHTPHDPEVKSRKIIITIE